MEAVRFGFTNSKYGDVEYFRSIMVQKLGAKWEKDVLNVKKDVSAHGIKRLGIPGRQGTVIQLSHKGKDYAVKVTRPGVACGDGLAKSEFGFLKQARLQQIASTFSVTVPVHAVFCGHKQPSFMVMDMLHKRLVDIYKGGNNTMSAKHQNQYWKLMSFLDTHVGVHFNDHNCLNIMTDKNDDIKIIDFDRSKMILWESHLNRKYEGKYLSTIHQKMKKDTLGFPNLYDIQASTCDQNTVAGWKVTFPDLRRRHIEMFNDPDNDVVRDRWDTGSRGIFYLGKLGSNERTQEILEKKRKEFYKNRKAGEKKK